MFRSDSGGIARCPLHRRPIVFPSAAGQCSGSAFDSSGATPISFTGALPTNGQAGQLFSYQHFHDNGYGYEITRIPNDCIEFGGRTYLQYTSVNTWQPASGHDGSLMAGVAYSDDYGVDLAGLSLPLGR